MQKNTSAKSVRKHMFPQITLSNVEKNQRESAGK